MFSQEVNIFIGGGYTDIRKTGSLIGLYQGDSSSFKLCHAPYKKKVSENIYDSILNNRINNTIDVSKEEKFLNSIVFKGNHYIFFYKTNKTSSSLYYKRLDRDGLLENSRHVIDEYELEEGKRKIINAPYSLQLSEDKNSLLIYQTTSSSSKENKDQTYRVFLFDSNMKKVLSVKRTYPVYYGGNQIPPKTLNIRKFFVEGSSIYFLYYVYYHTKRSSSLYWCDVVNGTKKEISLTDDKFITDTKVIKDVNNKLTLFGIYTNKKDKPFYARGIFLVDLDSSTPKYVPFSEEDVKSFKFPGGAVMGKQMKLFRINDISYTKDGGFVLMFQNVFERFSGGVVVAPMTGGSAASPNFSSGNTGGAGYSNPYSFGFPSIDYGFGSVGATLYHLDFAVIKVSPNNDLEWFRHVKDRKYHVDYAGSVFYYNEKSDKTFIVYNKTSKMLKPLSLNVLSFNNNGEFSDKILFSYKSINSLLKFSYQKKISDNSFIVPGFRIGKESYFKLIKISFN